MAAASRWWFSEVRGASCTAQAGAKPKTDEEKKKEAAGKVAEAAPESPPGKALKQKVQADPLVKTVKDARRRPRAVAAGAAAAAGVAALARKETVAVPAAGIPLDKITPGVSAQVEYEGP